MVVRSVSDSLPGTPGPPSLDGGRFGRNDLCQHVERRLPLATPRALTTTHLAQLAVAMLRPTLIRAAHVHKPLIRFPDRRAPKTPHDPQPHPSAPEEVAKNFDNFRKILETGPHFDPAKLKPFSLESSQPKAGGSASSSAKADAVDTLFDLPPRFWNTPSMRMSPAEMDAVQSGGASLFD